MDIWEQIEFFNREENWAEPDMASPRLLLTLDAYRRDLGIPLYVSKGLGEKGSHDATSSTHYEDDAGVFHGVDVIPLLSKFNRVTLLDCYIKATQFPFSGLGMYPDWKYTHGKIIERGGLHLDTGTHRRMPTMKSTGQWIGIMKNEGQEYVGVSEWNLRKYGILK